MLSSFLKLIQVLLSGRFILKKIALSRFVKNYKIIKLIKLDIQQFGVNEQ